MKLSLPTQALQSALDQVSRAAAPKVGNNAYAGILLSAADNMLEIQATDYQVSVRVRTPATVTEPGGIGRVFAGIDQKAAGGYGGNPKSDRRIHIIDSRGTQ